MQFPLHTLFRATILFAIAFALLVLVTQIDDPIRRVLPIATAVSVLGAGFGVFFSRGLLLFFIAGARGFFAAYIWAAVQYASA
jgi:hypothetical protein